MPFFATPTSFRLASGAPLEPSFSTLNDGTNPFLSLAALSGGDTSDAFATLGHRKKLAAHAQHPDFGHLTLLVMEAVLEVVFVALPGYIVARIGMFDADMQKFVANLNMMVFLPCLSTYTRGGAQTWGGGRTRG